MLDNETKLEKDNKKDVYPLSHTVFSSFFFFLCLCYSSPLSCVLVFLCFLLRIDGRVFMCVRAIVHLSYGSCFFAYVKRFEYCIDSV